MKGEGPSAHGKQQEMFTHYQANYLGGIFQRPPLPQILNPRPGSDTKAFGQHLQTLFFFMRTLTPSPDSPQVPVTPFPQ